MLHLGREYAPEPHLLHKLLKRQDFHYPLVKLHYNGPGDLIKYLHYPRRVVARLVDYCLSVLNKVYKIRAISLGTNQIKKKQGTNGKFEGNGNRH